MKKGLLLLLLAIIVPISLFAARAYPRPKTITQPDGSTITIIGHGDEFRHYVTTTDGYTVIKGNDGFYRYAVSAGGRLKASQVKASDVNCRTSFEINFLASIDRNLKPSISATGEKLRKLAVRNDAPFCQSMKRTGMKKTVSNVKTEPTNYRGLVILVNFTDRKFSRGENARQLVDDMMNKPGHTSYVDPLLNGIFRCTGSVRDYFFDNSNGKFLTEFDVVGPIEIDEDQYYINSTERTYELCKKVLETADSEIDFSRYDSDGNGEIDMIYLLYAGYASVYQGNDERLVWPHAGHFGDSDFTLTLDGKRVGRFACSSEIYGWEDYDDLFLDGIGIIVHEFSHVLGFKDHYDVSGYLNEDPGAWDVMAAGNYNGVFNDTPCGYNSYEKYAAGFISPRTVDRSDAGESVSLRPLSSFDDALRFRSTQDSTIFIIENRQFEKWDQHLPGHGMLVWRVDSCDNVYWDNNALNVNGRLHFKLIRAMGATRTLFQEIEDTDYDPFPGTRNVTDLTNYSFESDLLSDLNYPSPVILRDIEETDGIIHFTLDEDPDARNKPYTFALQGKYKGKGIKVEDNTECEWQTHTATVIQGNAERHMIYDLIADSEGISAYDPKYSEGLGASYSISGDKKFIQIEPYRVALLEDYGVWLVDFNDLDNGGSGAIVLNMNPYGDISVANPESIIGYCYLPKKSPLVTVENIIKRFSMVRNLTFEADPDASDIFSIKASPFEKNDLFNLRGIKVTNPKKGELYIIGDKKIVY